MPLSCGHKVSASFVLNNLLGNMVVFIPCGLYIQVMTRNKSVLRTVVTVAVLTAVIVGVQYAFGLGACDIDDVLLNTCGGALGALLYVG